MPNFIALGCLEVGEKFPVGGWWGGGISTPTTMLHQPLVGLGQVRLRLGWAVTINIKFWLQTTDWEKCVTGKLSTRILVYKAKYLDLLKHSQCSSEFPLLKLQIDADLE